MSLKIKLARSSVRSNILKDESTKAILTSLAESVAKKASDMSGESYESQIYYGKNRLYATIRATDNAAAAENARNNTLIKALGGEK